MFNQVPVHIWLLVAIAAIAYVPASYVFRYVKHSPLKRDITQPAQDAGWRTTGKFARNLMILVALGALAIFIFTPTAANIAHEPVFWPLLMVVFALWSLSTVPRGLATGRIQPIARGFYRTYARATQPKRFWTSIGWNALFSGGFLWLAVQAYQQAPVQALQAKCSDANEASDPHDVVSACNQLIKGTKKSGDDLAQWVNDRGSAYYRLGNYQSAMRDYSSAIRLDPNASSWRYNRGLVDEQLGKSERAVVDYSAAIHNDADNGDAYLNRGLIYLDAGNFNEAVSDFTRVHEIRPKDPAPLANRGIAYAWLKRDALARQDFSVVRSADPSNIVLLHGEALLSLNEGDVAGAIEQFTAAADKNPGDTWSIAMRARAERLLDEDK